MADLRAYFNGQEVQGSRFQDLEQGLSAIEDRTRHLYMNLSLAAHNAGNGAAQADLDQVWQQHDFAMAVGIFRDGKRAAAGRAADETHAFVERIGDIADRHPEIKKHYPLPEQGPDTPDAALLRDMTAVQRQISAIEETAVNANDRRTEHKTQKISEPDSGPGVF